MNAVLIYLLQVIIVSGVFYSFYYIFLKHLTFFRFNRFYLLFSLFFSLVIPFIHLPMLPTSPLPKVTVFLDELVVGMPSSEAIHSMPSMSLVTLFYVLVVLVLLLRVMFGVITILRLFDGAKVLDYKGKSLFVTTRSVNPFSVFKRILVNEVTLTDPKGLEQIVVHESAHIKQHHGVDSFVSELFTALMWVNPFYWIIKKDLKSTHEYLADEKVLEQDFDLANYFMLMLDNIVGKNVGLANNFNESLNLKRMKMMKKKRSSRFTKVMSLLTLPVFLVATLLMSNQLAMAKLAVPEKDDLQSLLVVGYNLDGTNVEKTVEDPMVNKNADVKPKTKGAIFDTVDVMPEFPGGMTALMNYLRTNVNYPAEAKKNKEQGRVFVAFVVNNEGKVVDVSIESGVSEALNNEAIRVVEAMPNWVPGKMKGKAVNVSYKLPINFALK